MSTTAAGRHFRDVMNPYVVVPDGWWGDMGPGVENLVARIENEAAAAALAGCEVHPILRDEIRASEAAAAAAARTALLDELETAFGVRLDALAVDVIGTFTEAAASIRGGVADAGREQCAREWAAQQVEFYASSQAGEQIAWFRGRILAEINRRRP